MSIDQRGTGRDALDCPALQDAMGASDLTPPPPKAVKDCAAKLGDDRRFYTTRDTVEDIEALRIALKADKLALNGTSYGTFVAQRYALAHPKRVSGLVLDSVVPSEGITVLSDVSIKATRRVMGEETTKADGQGHQGAPERPRAAGHAHRPLRRRAARQRRRQRDQDRRQRQHGPARRADRRRPRRDAGLGRPAAQPGPARQHAVRGHPGARGAPPPRRSKAASRRSTQPPPSSATTTSTPTTAPPRPATGSPSSA